MSVFHLAGWEGLELPGVPLPPAPVDKPLLCKMWGGGGQAIGPLATLGGEPGAEWCPVVVQPLPSPGRVE